MKNRDNDNILDVMGPSEEGELLLTVTGLRDEGRYWASVNFMRSQGQVVRQDENCRRYVGTESI